MMGTEMGLGLGTDWAWVLDAMMALVLVGCLELLMVELWDHRWEHHWVVLKEMLSVA